MSAHGPAPYVGFDLVPFRVRVDRQSGMYRDWEWQPSIEVRHIPGSNTAVVQHMGNPPATITLRLLFHDMVDYRSFLQKQGTTGVLTLLANATSAIGVVEHKLNVDYEHLDAVTLLRVGSALIPVGSWSIETEATFMRAMDPLTGLAAT